MFGSETVTFLGIKMTVKVAAVVKVLLAGASVIAGVKLFNKIVESRRYKELTGEYKEAVDNVKADIDALDEKILATNKEANVSIAEMEAERNALIDLMSDLVAMQHKRQVEDRAVAFLHARAATAGAGAQRTGTDG